MSTPSKSKADQLIDELLNNDDFRGKVESADSAETISALLMVNGYQITQGEWQDALTRLQASYTLADDELEEVAGGTRRLSKHVDASESGGGFSWDNVKKGFEAISDKISSIF